MASKQKKTLSILVDEGGDFGPADPHSPLYVVSFVLHDQSVDLGPKISYLSELVANCGYPGHAIHTYPLFRQNVSKLTGGEFFVHVGRDCCWSARQTASKKL